MKGPKQIDITPQEFAFLLKRTKEVLDPDDFALIKGMAETLTYLSQAVESRSISAKRLLQLVFGRSSEKTQKILQKLKAASSAEDAEPTTDPDPSKKRKGYGPSAYNGGNRVPISHEDLDPGDP